MTLLDWPALAADYGSYHTDRRNRFCHLLGVPLIVFCVARWAWPLPLLLLPLYVAWNRRLGALMTAIAVLLIAAARFTPASFFLPLFVLGWAFQFLGHWYEGRSPAFLRNLIHLLVGPMWVLKELVL